MPVKLDMLFKKFNENVPKNSDIFTVISDLEYVSIIS